MIRTATGADMNMGAQHSQTMYSLLTRVPGLKVAAPSNAHDAQGLMITAIRDESNPRCSVASDIAGLVASEAFHALKAPIGLVTAPHTPVPFARELERAYVPGPPKIDAAIRKALAT